MEEGRKEGRKLRKDGRELWVIPALPQPRVLRNGINTVYRIKPEYDGFETRYTVLILLRQYCFFLTNYPDIKN